LNELLGGGPPTEHEMRYTVQEIRGMAMGAGMFQVVDGNDGISVGEPCYWRDEAERRAGALNRADEKQNDTTT
jgi:hypothetical protein